MGKLNDYFKNILNDNHEKSNSKLEFKLSDHVKIENKSNKKIDEQVLKSEDISIDDNSERIQELYDGYIGEKNFIPNPYEYGPNATYRNINEGIVYKKNEQNLWEAFVKDGKPGVQGPRGFAGGGTGVEEVKRIVSDVVSTISLSGSVSAVDWSKITNIPVSTSSTSGIITSSDWNKFNNKVDINGNIGTASATELTIISNSASYKNFPTSPLEIDGNVNSYYQVNIQNQSSGTSASTDLVLTNDLGSDINNYVNLGINSSQYNATGWTINGKNDAYLYSSNSNLSIGTSATGKSLDIFAGGVTSSDKIVSFNSGFYKISASQIPVSYYNGQAGWGRRTIFSKFLGASVNSVSEVDVMASATAGAQQIDGGYPGSLYGIPPIIRPNFLSSGGYWLRSNGMFGLNLGSNSSYVIIREYWGSIKVSEITIVKTDFPAPTPTSSNNFP